MNLKKITDVSVCGNMEEAVRLASKISVSGDIVLLSPACASFDMYKNYSERGDDFIRCVEGL